MGELVNEKSALSQQAKTAYKAALKSVSEFRLLTEHDTTPFFAFNCDFCCCCMEQFGDADKIFYRTLLLRDGQTLLRMGDCVVAEIKVRWMLGQSTWKWTAHSQISRRESFFHRVKPACRS